MMNIRRIASSICGIAILTLPASPGSAVLGANGGAD